MRRLLLTPTVILFFFVTISAQSTNASKESNTSVFLSIKQKIRAAEESVKEFPDRLMFRKNLIAENERLYMFLYDKFHLSPEGFSLRNKTQDLELVPLLEKMRDLHVDAIRVKPEVALLKERLKYENHLHSIALKRFIWTNRLALLQSEDWELPARPRVIDHELELIKEYLALPSHRSRINAYVSTLKAKTLTKEFKVELREALASAYLERATYVSQRLRNRQELLLDRAKLSYSINDDLSKASINAFVAGKFVSLDTNVNGDYRVTVTHRSINLFWARILTKVNLPLQAIDKLNAVQKYAYRTHESDLFPCVFFSLRSELHLQMDKPEEALTDATMAIKRRAAPACGGVYMTKGNALLQLEKHSEAIENYTKELEGLWGATSIFGLPSRLNRGIAYFRTEQFQNAINDFSVLSERQFYTTELHEMWATAHEKLGQQDRAKKQRAIVQRLISFRRELREKERRKRTIYGKIVMPNGAPIDPRKSQVVIHYSNGMKTFARPVGGLFEFKHMFPHSFRISAYLDIEIDGEPRRYFVRPKKFIDPKGGRFGPIILELNDYVARD